MIDNGVGDSDVSNNDMELEGVIVVRYLGLAGLLLLTACSSLTTVSDYNKDLTDSLADKRVGIAFDMNNNRTRVYPETKTCIDLYSKNNGFVPVMRLSKKSIGMPVVDEMSDKHQEFWVSANGYIAVRVLYTGENNHRSFFSPDVLVSESVIAFKPEAGSFYYVTIDFNDRNAETGKYLRVYKIVDNASGEKTLQHVDMLNLRNCPGQQPWYTKAGAAI
ncbi:hypothetical protein AAHA48_18270 [Dickeya oryzae]|uniref:hypothetical protein n=1 Tax=Dickeya oryzae TaxID=1240404 RepID=UPI0031675BF4